MSFEAKALLLFAAYLLGVGINYGPLYYSPFCQTSRNFMGAPTADACAAISSVMWPIAGTAALSFSLSRPR